MNVEDERSRSPWMEIPARRFPRLEGAARADVLIIGSGIAGLSCAYELARLGRQVTIVDRGRIARGMTARTTAHLTFGSDDWLHSLGEHRARLWVESQRAAVARIESICEHEAIDCDFARIEGLLFPARDGDIDTMKKELDAAREAGLAVRWVEDASAYGVSGPAMVYSNQARFHPLKYLTGLIAALTELGAQFYEETAVLGIEGLEGAVRAETAVGDITAAQVIVAANAAFHMNAPFHTKLAPYRTYALAAPVPQGSVRDLLMWDTGRPGYHYVRLQPRATDDLLIVGGEDHKSGTQDDGYARVLALEAWARERFPEMGEITHAWSGQVMEPADGVGFIGATSSSGRVFTVTGDSGQGITTGAAASLILADLVSGRDNPFAELYDPGRTPHRGLGEFIKENVEALRHWAELATARELPSADDLSPGAGALIRIDGKPVAAYRDAGGELSLKSAVCTHAGCTVHFNSFEQSWDCPCHGSQFSVRGEVLQGPAVKPLGEAPEEKETGRSKPEDAARDLPRAT